MDDQTLIDFTEKLLSMQSFDRERSDVPAFVYDTLERYGARPEMLERAGIRNVVAQTSDERTVLFNGHWDTVLPRADYKNRDVLPVRTAEGAMYGLGASDMKSGVAAQCAAFVECLRQGVPGVVLCVVGDEELGGTHGTKLTLERGYRAPYVVLGEPTTLRLSLGQKGGLFAEATARGTLAHGAYPHRGQNAILRLYDFLRKLLDAYPPPPPGADEQDVFTMVTASVGTIRGGESTNVVPDRCTATVDVRIPPTVDAQRLEADLHRIAEEASVEIKTRFAGYGWQLDRASRIYEASRDAVERVTGEAVAFVQKLGTNDGRYYAYEGAQIVNIGPGDDRFSHTLEERVRLPHLTMARDIYVDVARRLVAEADETDAAP